MTGSSGGSLQEESVAVVTLQGSVEGGRDDLNDGVWLKALGGSGAPKVRQCHVQARLADMRPAPDDDECGKAFLLRDSDLSDEERCSQLRHDLDSVVAPTLQRAGLLTDLQDPAVIGRFAMGADAYHRLGLRGGLGETRW